MEPNVTIEDISPVERRISVSIPAEHVRRELDRAYRNLQKDVQLRGFRRGKVPRSVLQSHFQAQVENEVAGQLVNSSLDKAISSHNMYLVSQPVVEPAKLAVGTDFSYVATVEIKPEVVGRDYVGIPLTRERYQLDEGAVTRDLDKLRESRAELVVVEEDRPVQVGDYIRVEYSAFLGNVPLDKDQPRQGHLQVAEGSFLPGFSSQVEGMRKGETRTFDLQIPEDYNQKALAGQTLNFEVSLFDIKRRDVPALDDELAQDLEHENLDALVAKVRGDLEDHLKQASEIKIHRDAAAALVERNDVHLPQGLVNQQIELLAQEKQRQLGRQVRGRVQISEAEREAFKVDAEFRLRVSLILESIARLQEFEVTEADLQTRLEEIAAEAGRPVEAIRGLYMKNNAIEELKTKLLEEKALEFVIEKAEVTEVEKPFSEHAHDHEH